MKKLFIEANRGWLIVIGLLFILSIAASGYFVYTLSRYSAIEGIIVVAGASALILLISYILIFIIGRNALIKHHTKACAIIAIILLLLSMGQLFITHNYLNRFLGMLDNMQDQVIVFTTSIVVRTDSTFEKPSDLDDITIGIINDPYNEHQTYAAGVLVNDLDLSNDNAIKEYDSFIEIIYNILNGDLEAAILPGGFAETFATENGDLENIGSDLTTIYTRTFEVSKDGLTRGGDINEPFSILIMGIDAVTEDITRPDSVNPDTLLLMTVNPITLHATVLSIPRDSYMPIACLSGNRSSKIAHAGIGGERCIINTIENLTDIPIDYYVKINFAGVVRITDALDGIEVDVPIEFCEQDSQRRKGRHQICLNQGMQTLNGEEALALSRHRKTINDFERGFNNQLVLNALANEAKDVRDITIITNLLQEVSNNMKTNFTTNEMLSLLDLARLGFGDRPMNMQTLYLSGFDARIFEPSIGLNLYNFVLYNESIREISNAMKENLGIIPPTMIKEFSFSANTPFEVPEIGRGNFNRSDSTYDGRGMVNPNANNRPAPATRPQPETPEETTPEVPEPTEPEEMPTLPVPPTTTAAP